MTDTPTVAYVCDAGFLAPTLVSLHSLLSHRKGPVEVHVFHLGEVPGIERPLDRLRAEFPQARLHSARLELPTIEAEQHWTAATYGRLFLPGLLGRRVIYLDGDTLICDDIIALHQADLGGRPMGAVRDYPVERWHAHRSRGLFRRTLPWFAHIARMEPLLDGASYVNTGVLVLEGGDPAHEAIFTELADLAAALRFRAEHQTHFADQDWINHVMKGRITHLAPAWNLLWGNAKSDKRPLSRAQRKAHAAARAAPGLFHYVGSAKPWRDIPAPQDWMKRDALERYRKAMVPALRSLGPDIAGMLSR
ncbi:MAG: hypothetical protein JXQ91_02625 [Vannielia sp.]|uniref:glycosyltransferase family 8 protein n=1 Tax=Vannielia sp. TaxID=2813045 RepID=UPI003B8B8484